MTASQTLVAPVGPGLRLFKEELTSHHVSNSTITPGNVCQQGLHRQLTRLTVTVESFLKCKHWIEDGPVSVTLVCDKYVIVQFPLQYEESKRHSGQKLLKNDHELESTFI